MKLPIFHESQLFRFLEINSGELLIHALLKLPQVCIRNPANVSQKLESMINGGKNTLQVQLFIYILKILGKLTFSDNLRLRLHSVEDHWEQRREAIDHAWSVR